MDTVTDLNVEYTTATCGPLSVKKSSNQIQCITPMKLTDFSAGMADAKPILHWAHLPT